MALNAASQHRRAAIVSVDDIHGIGTDELPQLPHRSIERPGTSLEWNPDVLQLGLIERPLPGTGIPRDDHLVAAIDHRIAKINDVTRKPAGVGAEGEVEDAEGGDQ